MNLTTTGTINANLLYDLDFRVGIDAGGGFLDTSQSQLNLGARVHLGNAQATAQFGMFNFAVQNLTDSDPIAGADTLRLDLNTTWNTVGKVYNLTTDLLNVRASGDVDLDLRLTADMGNAALPTSRRTSPSTGRSARTCSTAPGSTAGASRRSRSPTSASAWAASSDVHPADRRQARRDPGADQHRAGDPAHRHSGVLPTEWAAILDVVPDAKPGHQVTLLDFIKLAIPASTSRRSPRSSTPSTGSPTSSNSSAGARSPTRAKRSATTPRCSTARRTRPTRCRAQSRRRRLRRRGRRHRLAAQFAGEQRRQGFSDSYKGKSGSKIIPISSPTRS